MMRWHNCSRRWVFGLLLAGLGCASSPETTGRFQADRFLGHVKYLADDQLAGRGLGSPGIDAAADYIADEFAAAGLRPGGDDGKSYFQTFELVVRKERSDAESLTFEGVDSPPDQSAYTVLPFSSGEAFEGEAAFVGYGITAEEHQYDDYAHFDAKGKVLLMLRYEPRAADREAKFGGKQYSRFATFVSKATTAKQQGAKAVLIVNPPTDPDHEGDDLFAFLPEMTSSYGIPMFQVSQSVAEGLVQAGGLPALATLQKQCDADRKGFAQDLKGVVIKGDPGIRRVQAASRNVIGVLPGTGPQRDEWIVIGAHYDHLGKTVDVFGGKPKDGSPRVEEIHNGADDNASGTAGLIELGRAFSATPKRNRGLMFIAFTGEERGLLGSEHFVQHSTVPMEKIVAMLNMDMIGRLKENKLQVFGADSAEEFSAMIAQRNAEPKFELKAHGSAFGPSDHSSFYKRKIPAIHFFTGSHADYHRPGDDWEKVNAEGAAKVLSLIYDIGLDLVSSPERPAYQKVAAEAQQRTMMRVRFGIMPSYGDNEKGQSGMAITGVSPGSPADKAGLQAEDRITKIDDHQIDTVYDFMAVLGAYEPKDVVTVVVNRAGKPVTMKVTLEASK